MASSLSGDLPILKIEIAKAIDKFCENPDQSWTLLDVEAAIKLAKIGKLFDLLKYIQNEMWLG